MRQELSFGFGAINRLRRTLDRLSVSSALVVTGRASFDASGAAVALRSALAGVDQHRYCGFTENPKIEEVMGGIRELRTVNVQAVVAVGGGSVMDMAKLVNALAYQKDAAERIVCEGAPIDRPGLPLIAIPTTAGSGSEATHFAVVYVGHVKHSVASPYLLPRVAIVDPSMTLSMPPHLTASTGMDAFAQAVESFWSIYSTGRSKEFARRAISLVLDHLQDAVLSPSHRARRAMSKAAYLAGCAINITKTTGAHALSYPLTSYFGIPHGQAVSLTLGDFLVFNSEVTEDDVTDPRGAGYVRCVLAELARLLKCRDAVECRDRIRKLMTSIGLQTNLAAFGISREKAVDLVVRNVNAERLVNNPRALTTDHLTHLVEAVC